MKIEEAIKILRERFGNVTVFITARHASYSQETTENTVDVSVFMTDDQLIKKVCTTLDQCVQEHLAAQETNNQHVNAIVQQVEEMAKG